MAPWDASKPDAIFREQRGVSTHEAACARARAPRARPAVLRRRWRAHALCRLGRRSRRVGMRSRRRWSGAGNDRGRHAAVCRSGCRPPSPSRRGDGSSFSPRNRLARATRGVPRRVCAEPHRQIYLSASASRMTSTSANQGRGRRAQRFQLHTFLAAFEKAVVRAVHADAVRKIFRLMLRASRRRRMARPMRSGGAAL